MSTATRVIRPIDFTMDQLVSTNATNPHADWVAGSYSAGQRVTHTAPDGWPHHYESLANSNTAVPGTDSTKWLDMGEANTVAMFNRLDVSSRTTKAGTLVVVLQPNRFMDSVGLFGMAGDIVQLEVLETDGVTVVQSETLELLGRSVNSMLDYLWEPFLQVERAVFESLPVFPGRRIRITITGPTTAVGAMCYGNMRELGPAPDYGAQWELTDFLGVTRDDYGNLQDLFPEAPYADTVSFSVMVEKGRIPAWKADIAQLRRTSTVWIGNGGEDSYRGILIVLGVFDQVSLTVNYHSHSLFDLRVIGVTSD